MAFFYRSAASPVPPSSPMHINSDLPGYTSVASSSSLSLDEGQYSTVAPRASRPATAVASDRRSRRKGKRASGKETAGDDGSGFGVGGVAIPTIIPDLRFEQSYLASIRGFIHELEPAEARREKREAIAAEKRRKEGAKDLQQEEGQEEGEGTDEQATPTWVEARNPKGEPELWIGRLRIDWVPLLYVTFRDQLLSPLVQGAVWGVAGLCLAQAKGIIRTFLFAPRRRVTRGAADTGTFRGRTGGVTGSGRR